MNSNEFVPVLSGLVLGSMLSGSQSPSRSRWAFLFTVLLGFLTTFASGELRISWTYVFADIALVAVSALGAFIFSLRLRNPARVVAGCTQQLKRPILSRQASLAKPFLSRRNFRS